MKLPHIWLTFIAGQVIIFKIDLCLCQIYCNIIRNNSWNRSISSLLIVSVLDGSKSFHILVLAMKFVFSDYLILVLNPMNKNASSDFKFDTDLIANFFLAFNMHDSSKMINFLCDCLVYSNKIILVVFFTSNKIDGI